MEYNYARAKTIVRQYEQKIVRGCGRECGYLGGALYCGVNSTCANCVPLRDAEPPTAEELIERERELGRFLAEEAERYELTRQDVLALNYGDYNELWVFCLSQCQVRNGVQPYRVNCPKPKFLGLKYA